uniref:Protein kinase domain-containing protein n=1 Tax=Meloidogyne enterolobii TaxID=390850 RepID=A0A6V7UGP4_MELEN|nr:unnamed protein product [Meloidogyne enterolobii]
MKILLLLLFQTLIFGLLNIQELDAGTFKKFFGIFTKCFKPIDKNGKNEKSKAEKHKSSFGDFFNQKEEEEHERQLLEKISRVVDIPTFNCEHGKELKKQIIINYKTKEFKINFDFENKIGEGAYSQIYHAYMELEEGTSLSSSKNSGKCVALKISKYTTEEEKLSVNRELKILKYFADIPQNFIIGMHAHDTVDEEYYYSDQSKKIYSDKYIILELGGVDLLKFYNEQIIKDEDLVTKIAKGAAKALSQFNEHAIHLDIKPTNFLVHSQNDDEIEFKLIDFNTSFLITDMKGENININLARKFRPPEIRENFKLSEKIDTWQFGIMLYELQDKRDGAKTPSYSPLTKSPLSSFRTSSPFPSPKYSHKSPSIQGSTGEIIEMASASTINYDKFDNELNNYRLDESKNRLVDRVIKVIIN